MTNSAVCSWVIRAALQSTAIPKDKLIEKVNMTIHKIEKIDPVKIGQAIDFLTKQNIITNHKGLIGVNNPQRVDALAWTTINDKMMTADEDGF